jgi:hypothetical protein
MEPSADYTDGYQFEPVYLMWNKEMLIDAPRAQVWRHVLNYPSWQNYAIARHISGPVQGEGEVVLLKKEEAGVEFPPYYARTIWLEPERRIIWKTYPETRGSGSDFFGIVDFTVADAQGGTRFGYNILYEFVVPYRAESELQAFHKQQYESSEAVFAVIFPKLKKLAEQTAVSRR